MQSLGLDFRGKCSQLNMVERVCCHPIPSNIYCSTIYRTITARKKSLQCNLLQKFYYYVQGWSGLAWLPLFMIISSVAQWCLKLSEVVVRNGNSHIIKNSWMIIEVVGSPLVKFAMQFSKSFPRVGKFSSYAASFLNTIIATIPRPEVCHTARDDLNCIWNVYTTTKCICGSGSAVWQFYLWRLVLLQYVFWQTSKELGK